MVCMLVIQLSKMGVLPQMFLTNSRWCWRFMGSSDHTEQAALSQSKTGFMLTMSVGAVHHGKFHHQ